MISAGAAKFLARTYGDSTAFRDSSERDWGWPDRSFTSFSEATWEVSRSRFYGGIHYYNAILEGRRQGNFIGDLVMDKLLGPSKELAKNK